MRPDLEAVRHSYQGRDYWVVKDPVALKFYRFEEEEYALLQMLDGHTSADQIRRRFAYDFAPQKITNQELFQFVGSLFRSSLLISDAAGQGGQLLRRGDEGRRKMRRASMTNVLAIRFRGFDPDGLLSWLNRYLSWIFSWPVFVCSVLLFLSALALIFTHFEHFQQKLPGFHEFFAAKNWIWLGLTLALTKVLHELGHGLACKRFGSQCHSMGIMFLVLMPCLYCDVSDSWTLANKWRRAAIAAAGMYFEFILASTCAFIWWFSEPGMVNMLALNVVFVCSVSTVLFNANPLLRYDGYYILADMIEVPNLRQKATSILRRSCGQWMLGLRHGDDPFLPKRHRGLFVTYSIAALLYRWIITFSIFWFVYKLLEPYGLKVIGQALAMMALYGLIGVPLIQLFRFFAVPGRLSSVKPKRFGITVAVAVLVLLGILLIPTPHYIRCSFIVQPQDAAKVYVAVPGITDQVLAAENTQVTLGQPLLVLKSPELDQVVVALEGEAQRAKTRYHSTLQQANFDVAAEKDVAATLTAYNAIHNQLQQRREDLERLVLTAPISGTVVTASYIAKKSEESGRLGDWHGHPLQARNRGAYLQQGTLVCQVVPQMERLEAILAIDQADIEFVKSGNSVELWIRQLPGKVYDSHIDIISPQEMKIVPKGLSSKYGGDLLTTVDNDGLDKPQSTTFQVRVPLNNAGQTIMVGATGFARIKTGHQTVGQRIWRFVCKTFRFDL